MEKPNNCINIQDICAPKVFSEVKAVVVSAIVVFVALVVIVAAAVIVAAVGIVAGVVVIVMHPTGSWQSHNNQPSPLTAFFPESRGRNQTCFQSMSTSNQSPQQAADTYSIACLALQALFLF